MEQRQRQEDANARSRALSLYGWFRAQYSGQCSQCGERFKVGDPICAIDGGYKSYCCLDT